MVKVKICGITNAEDALAAVKAGCDGLGFVFYRPSRRYISPGKAKGIIERLPASVKRVGVFVDASEGTVKRIARACRLDMLQFHGRESPAFCRRFRGYKVIKAFRIKNKKIIKDILNYNCWGWLWDAFLGSQKGGTGKTFNWSLMRNFVRPRKTLFLSGGLNENNVLKAIAIFNPDWVDVSSSVEKSPGSKDRNKIRRFINSVRGKAGLRDGKK